MRRELLDGFQAAGHEVILAPTYTHIEQHLSGTHLDSLLIWSDKISVGGLPATLERFAPMVPTYVLEERPSLLAIVRSLRAGVADYIRMPCHFPEILARVERGWGSQDREMLAVGRISLDERDALARIETRAIILTSREALILGALMRSPDTTVSRDDIHRVTGITRDRPGMVDSYLKKLRKRHPYLREHIKTVYGRGYLLESDGKEGGYRSSSD
jgi:DNA-binding response OmpR family regulator